MMIAAASRPAPERGAVLHAIRPIRPVPRACAVALALLAAAPAGAVIGIGADGGPYYAYSGNVITWSPASNFPPDPTQMGLDLTGTTLSVGDSDVGSFSALAGALMQADSLHIGNQPSGNGTFIADGAGTLVQLSGGAGGPRFVVGDMGTAFATISGGAVVDASQNMGVCTSAGGSCQSQVSNTSSGTGTLTITDPGSQAVLIQPSVGTVWINTTGYGVPGGTSTGTVNVIKGGQLNAIRGMAIAGVYASPGLNGSEQAYGTVKVDGPGSELRISTDGAQGSDNWLNVGQYQGAHGTLTVSRQGRLVVDDALAHQGNAVILVGNDGGSGSFSVLSGGSAQALYLLVGSSDAGFSGPGASTGTVTVDGAGSRIDLLGIGATNGNPENTGGPAFLLIGWRANGAMGTVTVSNGGTINISDNGANTSLNGGSNPGFEIAGLGTGNVGTLNITGANSRVMVQGSSLGVAPGTPDNYNPYTAVGRGAGNVGTLNISGGGQLQLVGNAQSTVSDPRLTGLYIGGSDATESGSWGSATVTGAGSAIIMSGNSDLIVVGRGSGATGLLSVLDQAQVSTTSIVVGDRGAVGSLAIDNASVSLSGIRTDVATTGAGASFGRGDGGVGALTLSNGAQLSITNNSFAGGISLGGDKFLNGGAGTASLSGGSSIELLGSVKSGISVGYSGAGAMTLSGASSVNAGIGVVLVARTAGSSGLLSLADNSTVTGSYVGIGAFNGVDGGAGTLVLNHGTVTAARIENGSGGLITGKWGLLKGNVTNRGQIIPDPPNDPGTLTIDGDFINQAGGNLVLDIADDGHGGFTTSHLVFTAGHSVDLTGLKVAFDFLGTTDPKAFAATGQFNLDTFLNSLSAGGVSSGLSTTFAAGQGYANWFTSPSQFSFKSDTLGPLNYTFSSTDGTGSFTAAVPEPAHWTILLAGLGLLGLFCRRRLDLRHQE